MRLGQLARKLAVRPAEIMEFLASNNVQINENSNTRLEQDQMELVVQRFAADRADELIKELSPKENITDVEAVAYQEEDIILPTTEDPQTQPSETIESSPAIEPESAADVIDESLAPKEQTAEEKIEIIKAPKIALSGLKVIGKIDLPEDKKKESPSPEEERLDNDKTGSKKTNRKKEKSNQPSRNPIALAREREAQEAAKKRLAEEERQKQKRRENYLKKVKKSDSIKPASAQNKTTKPVPEITDKRDQPKTWIGKFIKWITNS
jgi:hypothetical protein